MVAIQKSIWDDFGWSLYTMGMKESDIRKLLEVTQDENFINLGGGLPGDDSFPYKQLEETITELVSDYSRVRHAYQYSSTVGIQALRRSSADFLNRNLGTNLEGENIVLTTGAQQAIYLITRTLLNPEDTVITSSPTYLGFNQAVRPMKIKTIEVPIDKDGMIVEEISGLVENHIANGGEKPKFLYAMPDAHNPKSVNMSLKRREALLDYCIDQEFPILEDNPYSLLRYEGDHIDGLKKLDDSNIVSLLFTFSKLLCPGFRVGGIASEAGSDEKDTLLTKVGKAKQPADLCSNTFTQHVANEFLEKKYIDKHIPNIVSLYREKRDKMAVALKENFGDLDTEINVPETGLFYYLQMPEGTDTTEMLNYALKEKVVYIRGAAFYNDSKIVTPGMRINFSSSSIERNTMGIERLRVAYEKNVAKR